MLHRMPARFAPRFLGLGLLVSLWSALASAQTLTPDQQRALEGGQRVVVVEELPDSPWPRVTVLQLLPARPGEAAAVFIDYARHARYLPNVLSSAVSLVIDPATAEVSYVLSVPIVADESYTVRNRLTVSAPADSSLPRSYRIAWTLVRARSTKAADGEARFEPHRAGTLFTYRNLVVPGGRIAGLGAIKRKAQRDVEATAAAIAAEIERVRSSDRELLARQLLALPAAPLRSPRAPGSPAAPRPPSR